MRKKKQQPGVLEVLSKTAATQAALSLDEVKEALRIGSKERQQAEARAFPLRLSALIPMP